MTAIDLEAEMGQNLLAAYNSSLPPSPTQAGYDYNSTAVVRHESLPSAPTLLRINFLSTVEGSIEETDETINSDDLVENISKSVRMTELPSQAYTTHQPTRASGQSKFSPS